MLFNSLQFVIFFPTVVLLYWLLPAKIRNYMLLVASYYFYMNWQPAFGLLLAGASLVAWGGALLTDRLRVRAKASKAVFISTLCLLIGSLFTFKYLGFCASAVADFLDMLHLEMTVPRFEILLPVGISFFTFQALGYVIDVRRGTVPPERNLLTVMLYLAFFPQLVAGPIERAKDLLPQFKTRHRFNTADLMAGAELMVLGYFMKLCVADFLGPEVNYIYGNLQGFGGWDILLATFFFAFQIFGDFGGYSLIAIGGARCMGFRLARNFRQPYLATSVRDFWHRWHISLTRWLTDYVYIPLGGSRVSKGRHYVNIMITMILSGLWHGADYTYLLWGVYHGGIQVTHQTVKKTTHLRIPANKITKAIRILFTFALCLLGLVLFRAADVQDAGLAFKKIFTEPIYVWHQSKILMCQQFLVIAILMGIELRHELKESGRHADPYCNHGIEAEHSVVRSALYIAFIVILMLMFSSYVSSPFLYFQF